MRRLLEKIMRKGREEKIFPGCVVGLIRLNDSEKKLILPFGAHSYGREAISVRIETVFDIASMTKAITATLLCLLIDRGLVRLDTRVSKILSNFRGRGKGDVTLRHLLTYTLNLDIPSLSTLVDLSGDAIKDRILRASLSSPPGEKQVYANPTAFLMGLVVEAVAQQPLHVFAAENLFTPLGMRNTTFFPGTLPQSSRTYTVPTEVVAEWDEERQKDTMTILQGVPHDESARVFFKEERSVGHAGVFSTAPDLLLFLEMLLNEGILRRSRCLSEEMVHAFYTRKTRISDTWEIGGFGWPIAVQRWMGEHCPEDTFGWTGFTGCSFLCSPSKKVGLVILSNRLFPVRPPGGDRTAINAFRSEIADVVFQNT